MKYESRQIEYHLATVTECIDKVSGIVIVRQYEPYYRFEYVRERLIKMCEKHDLQYNQLDNLPSICTCSLKKFNNIDSFHTYIKEKAKSEPYFYKIKGDFVLARIGKDKDVKTYIYKITSNNLKT